MSKALGCTVCKNLNAPGPFSAFTNDEEGTLRCVWCCLVRLRVALMMGCSITVGPPTVVTFNITGVKDPEPGAST